MSRYDDWKCTDPRERENDRADRELSAIEAIATRIGSSPEELTTALVMYREDLSVDDVRLIAALLTRTAGPNDGLQDVCMSLATAEYRWRVAA